MAAFAQSVSGFGFALAAVPLLSIFVDPATAVVTATLGSSTLCAVTSIAERPHIDWRATRILTGSSLIGMPFGLLCLKFLPDSILRAVIAVVVAGCLILVWRAWKMPYTAWRVSSAGAFAGVLQTATGTNGPPLVAALQALGLAPRAFRATLAATFMATGTIAVVGFFIAKVVTPQAIVLSGLGAVACVGGGWIGNKAFLRVNAASFRRVVLVGLAGCAAVALLNAAFAL